ncbi:hypothetical protein [Wolbachia endosymbiont (group A) of Anoplius nigerrimus]|uniref:hypothetical protein n=1 Tax=Wolbachia endosymbiont (group A) of Anoplius nigerrimus TaxID=2953979 RepID=UPI0022321D13|nr:hypothetical protein [Wolbachia endosymbiont (group A) of Anoplius nigerrimus]
MASLKFCPQSLVVGSNHNVRTVVNWIPVGFVASHLILVVIYDKYHVAISNLAIPISVN